MTTGSNCLRIFSVMITDWETNFTDLQANDFGNLAKNHSGNILVGNHAVIFTEMISPRIFFRSVMFVWRMVNYVQSNSVPSRLLPNSCLLNSNRTELRGSFLVLSRGKVMLGRDCVRAVFRNKFHPPQSGSKVGFREYPEMGFKWVQKRVLTHFHPLLHSKTHF